ncbi:MAG: hypothetical protein LBQ63_04785 [Deltaproteobacteria bacterium]|jgi:hypothetical protein|nr:hypothetical protein [Deltaproteobacteria bacterium]
MLRIITAHTSEVDDPEEAVAEILTQIEAEQGLLKNSVGLLACCTDFIYSGSMKMLCARLPFDVIGISTLASATGASGDILLLTLCVLTSDELEFSPVLTEPLTEQPEKSIREAYALASGKRAEKPSFLLVYAPINNMGGGESLIRMIDAATGKALLFGSLACDHNFDSHEACVLYQGKAYRDRLILLPVYGRLETEFFFVSIPEANIQKQLAIITGSEGNVLKKVNDVNFLEYLYQLKLIQKENAGTPYTQDALNSIQGIPLLVDYHDGRPPAARTVYSVTPEGYAFCGGDMPVGATFALGSMDYDDILNSTRQALAQILDSKKRNGLLISSNRIRSFSLGPDPLAEIKTVKEELGQNIPFHLCYSGGVLCPVRTADGNTLNAFHNFTFAACLF